MLAEITLIGYLGSKEFKYGEDNRRYAMLKMATDFFRMKDNRSEEFTMWHTIFVNDRYMVDKCDLLEKGDLIYARGSLKYSMHTMQDGTKTITPYCSCDKLRLVKKGKAHLESDQAVLEMMKKAEEERKKEEEERKHSRPLFTPKEELPFGPANEYDEDLPF